MWTMHQPLRCHLDRRERSQPTHARPAGKISSSERTWVPPVRKASLGKEIYAFLKAPRVFQAHFSHV